MKNLLLYITIALLVVGCSKSKSGKIDVLTYADSLIRSKRADKALTLLRHYNLQSFSTPSERAKYALLFTQATDKNYIVNNSDSLIRMAVAYYDKTNDVESQAKAHFYLSVMYSNRDSASATVRELLYVLPLAARTCNYDLQSCVKNNLAYLCYSHRLYKEADSLYRELMPFEQEHKDMDGVALSYEILGEIYNEWNVSDHYIKSEKYLKKAYSLSRLIKTEHIKNGIITSLCELYANRSNYVLSNTYARIGLASTSNPQYLSGYYSVLGDNCTTLRRYDSAIYYLKKALPFSTVYIKEDSYKNLLYIAKKRKKMSDVIRYSDLYDHYKDSARQREHPIEVQAALKDMLYKQSQQKYNAKVYYWSVMLYVSVAVIVLILLMVMYMRYKSNKRFEEFVLRYRKVRGEIDVAHKQLEANKKETEMLQKEMDVAGAEKMKTYYMEMLELQKQKQHALMEELRQKDEERMKIARERGEELVRMSAIYEEFRQIKRHNMQGIASVQKPTTEQWRKLLAEMNYTRSKGKFEEELVSRYGEMTEEDIYFCCLVCLGVKYADIAQVMGCAVRTVYARAEKVEKRMNLPAKTKLREVLSEI